MEENKMFKNIGGKIKGLAKVICYVGIAISVIAGIFMILPLIMVMRWLAWALLL